MRDVQPVAIFIMQIPQGQVSERASVLSNMDASSIDVSSDEHSLVASDHAAASSSGASAHDSDPVPAPGARAHDPAHAPGAPAADDEVRFGVPWRWHRRELGELWVFDFLEERPILYGVFHEEVCDQLSDRVFRLTISSTRRDVIIAARMIWPPISFEVDRLLGQVPEFRQPTW